MLQSAGDVVSRFVMCDGFDPDVRHSNPQGCVALPQAEAEVNERSPCKQSARRALVTLPKAEGPAHGSCGL